MKKTFAVFLTLILLFSVTSCKKVTDKLGVAASMPVTSAVIHTENAENTVSLETVSLTEESSSESVIIKTTETNEITLAIPTTALQTQQTTVYSASCTIRISCQLILNNEDKLKSGKREFLPSSGVILETTNVKINGDETVYDILRKVCAENVCTDNCEYCIQNGIHMESSYTPGYDNYYIEGIHQIYEKDCGSKSGWMYRVNGVFPNTGCSSYPVKDGDVIEWVYTLYLGEDVGGNFDG